MDERTGNDKWKMFKNFLHNELGVDKGTIQEWIREAVKDEVRALLDQERGSFDVERIVGQEARRIIFGEVNPANYQTGEMKRLVADSIAKDLKVTVSAK